MSNVTNKATGSVMIDTNVWIDVILARPALVEESKGAIMACLEDGVEVLIAATSLKDVFYFAAKSAGADAGYQAVKLILEIASLAQVDESVCKGALALEQLDYEDGIVAACALAENARSIITRDNNSFNDLSIPKYSPAEFLEQAGYKAISL